MSYQERLYGYLEQLALQASTSAAATLPSGQRAASREAEDPASLFRQVPRPSVGENPLLDEMGRFAGIFFSQAFTMLLSLGISEMSTGSVAQDNDVPGCSPQLHSEGSLGSAAMS